MPTYRHSFILFFFPDTPTTEIYTLSLHDALPISRTGSAEARTAREALALGQVFVRAGMDSQARAAFERALALSAAPTRRSEEHTSELQSRRDLVCRLLLEKKNYNLHKTTYAVT